MSYARRNDQGDWVEIIGGFTLGEVQYPAGWPALANAAERADIGLAEIVETPQSADLRVTGNALDDIDGVPTRRWIGDPMTAEEIRARDVPQAVTPRQLQLALLEADLLDAIEAFLANEQTPRAARIAWEYATEYRRDDPTLNLMAQQLDPPLSAEQIDQLFIAAATIK